MNPLRKLKEKQLHRWAGGYARQLVARRFAERARGKRHLLFAVCDHYEPLWGDADARTGRARVESWRLSYPGLDIFRDADGRLRYAFIHGNWCLANARDDGRWCGVDDEIPLLFETGCYADFTFPAAPNECQPNIVNQIYWPSGALGARRAYENGERARVGIKKSDRILMIQGPLALTRRPGSIVPRIEGAALTAKDPGTPSRIRNWVDQGISVQGRPEWVFVKVHTHGAPEAQAAALLGEPARAMHRELADSYNDGKDWSLHYVTAREMFNIALAAMDGLSGDPNAYRDYVLAPPPAAHRSPTPALGVDHGPVRSFL